MNINCRLVLAILIGSFLVLATPDSPHNATQTASPALDQPLIKVEDKVP
jgi:hypothetical protein